MKIAIEEISSVKKAITIEIPEEVVAQELKAAYTDLGRRVRVPGFRPGKAPFSILEKRYAKDVEEDVIRKLVPDYYRKAIREARLSPVEPPTIENVELKKNSPMMFRATVEIKPAFDLGEYKGLKVSRQSTTVQPSDVEKTLEGLRDKQAVLEAHPPDHPIETNDYALIDFKGSIAGRPFQGGTGQGVLVQVGSKALIAGFEEQLIGHAAGEKIDVRITFPSDYNQADLAGKEASFEVEVREVKKKVLPALDDELAKDLGGYENLEDLKRKIHEGLGAQLKREEERTHRKALVKQLAQLHALELPPSLVEREIQDLVAGIQSRLPSGMTLEEARMDPKALRAELEPMARENVKGRWILEAIADQNKIEVSEEELEAALGRMAEGFKVATEDLKRFILSREGSLEGIRRQLREDKALDLVYREAVFV